MCDILGYKNFCSACKGSRKENGELICRAEDGRFYGLPVKQVLMAPCMKPKIKGCSGECDYCEYADTCEQSGYHEN